MYINSMGNFTKNRIITLLSKDNPFKKGTLQYYLLSFVIQFHDTLSKYSNDDNNKRLLKFLSTKKEAFFVDSWNGSKLFDLAMSLSSVHNIIKISKKNIDPSFGTFAEDGLFNVLTEPKFIEHLQKAKKTDNTKLLWLSLYMNQKIKKAHHVPQIKFDKPNFSYSEKSFNINLSNVPYNEIYNSTLEIPLAAFPDSWHSDDWIALNSRGLFHHIGDHVGFFYGASSVGDCYFLGRSHTNHLVTLSTPALRHDIENERDFNNDFYKLFSHIHPTDLVYVYGVPKGNPDLFDDPMLISSEVQDCKQNDTKNVMLAEHFWNNSVFMKNSHRKMFVGSIEDKLKDILENVKDLLTPEQAVIAQKIINNEQISRAELIKNNLSSLGDLPPEKTSEFMKRSAFFMKSLAHKTVCEIINPIDNLELGFFMKHNGSTPKTKTFFIFALLLSAFKYKQRKITKPLFHMKERFIASFLKEDKDYVNMWSSDSKKGFLFSEIVSMRNEYRMFIINNRVVATSACFRNTVPLNAWQNGRFDPRLVNGHNGQETHINRDRVAKYAKFARNFCAQMREENPACHSYVLDVAWCDEKATVVPIEINSITWSGAYQVNMHRVCAATIKKAFNYDHLTDFMTDKCNIWIDLINSKLIENSMFELCGLDRTLKGGTLPALSFTLHNTISSVEKYDQAIKDIKDNGENTDNNNIPSKHSITTIIEELDKAMQYANTLSQEEQDIDDEYFDDDVEDLDNSFTDNIVPVNSTDTNNVIVEDLDKLILNKQNFLDDDEDDLDEPLIDEDLKEK